jgi:hypothetical protein
MLPWSGHVPRNAKANAYKIFVGKSLAILAHGKQGDGRTTERHSGKFAVRIGTD